MSELKAFVQHLHATFTDLRFTTGNRLRLPFLVISRLEGGKVAEDWELFDSAGMRRQLEGGAAAAV